MLNLSQEKKVLASRLIQEYKYRWSLHARDKQKLPIGDWQTWLLKAGRGFGKTRVGAETVRYWKNNYPIIHLVGATASDVRDIMIEGESGLLSVTPKWEGIEYHPSKRRITWENGSKALLFSADEPDRLRGPQCYKAWADELAAWRYPESWDQLQFGLRLGNNPQCIVTTTPRPTKIIKELAKSETTIVTSGSSYENKANLADAFFDKIIKKYEGTRLGRQELEAEILEDVEGALWNSSTIERNRVNKLPEFKRIVIAIDPAVTSNEDSDETGIIVCALGADNYGYILDDFTGIYTPDTWARKAVFAYEKYQADRIIAEVNQGGDLVEANIRTVNKSISYKAVRAFKGKFLRAEPVAALSEQNRIKFFGSLPKLEDELTNWDATTGERSPNRLDAMVYGITELMLKSEDDTNFWA